VAQVDQTDAAGRKPRRPAVAAVAAILVVAFGVGLVLAVQRLWDARPRLTAETARSVVVGRLQQEARRSFVVTGALDLTVTTRVRHTRRLLPGLLDVNVGSVESTVRAPGRVSYGFPIAALAADSIEVVGDTIIMRVPAPRVFSVEPSLSELSVRTRSGWLQLVGDERAEVQQKATALVETTLRAQAERHLRTSEQPRVNTAATLTELLRPSFRAAGLPEPVFRFIISENLVYRSTGG
jgi:Protein of unknown function (DUF4230)